MDKPFIEVFPLCYNVSSFRVSPLHLQVDNANPVPVSKKRIFGLDFNEMMAFLYQLNGSETVFWVDI